MTPESLGSYLSISDSLATCGIITNISLARLLSILKQRRSYNCVIHIDIINGQVWIQANNTDRLIAEELVAAGIPAKSIVLGLQPPDVRPYTAYGVPCSEQQRESLKV